MKLENLLFQNSNGLAQKIHGPLEKVVWYAARDVTAGATGATMAAPELSDALILFQPSRAACTQYCRGCTNNIPVVTSLAALLPDTHLNKYFLLDKSFFTEYLKSTNNDEVLAFGPEQGCSYFRVCFQS